MSSWITGFEQVLAPYPLTMMLVGVLLGLVIGALPGFSSTMGVAVLVPFTFVMEPLPGLTMLLGLTASAMYAGAIPAILLNAPGTPGAAATTIDGYPLTQQGKSGQALTVSLVASVVGGIVGVVLVASLAPGLAEFALSFGPPELFMLAVFALTVIATVSRGKMLRGLICGLLGVGISTIGLDPVQAYARYSFDITAMTSGIEYIPVLIGLFGVAEALRQFERMRRRARLTDGKVASRFAVKAREWRRLAPSGALSSFIGFAIGVVPGAGGTIASFVAYNEAKRLARDSSEFGHGDLRGVGSAESSNNASIAGALAPTLTLGIPGDGVTAILLGALTVHGITPGPQLFTTRSDLVYGVFAGLLVVYLMVLIVGWVGIRMWVQVIRIPTNYLWPVVLLLCVIGTYALRSNPFDIFVMLLFGVLGYLLLKGGFPIIPLLIGIILGPIAETGFRRAMVLHGGGVGWMFQPVVLALLALTVIALALPPLLEMRKRSRAEPVTSATEDR